MLLKIENLTKSFDKLKVIENLNLNIEKNEIVAIIGPSGCGKSTLLNIISGIVKKYEGQIHTSKPTIGYVFQEDRLLPWMNVLENVKIVNDNSKEVHALRIIEEVGLKNFEKSYPDTLSGGMRQRCAIARGFNYDCDLLLMDEPFKSLDYNLRIEMLNTLIKLWNKSKKSILFITHEIDEAITVANRIIVLKKRPTGVAKEIILDKESIGNRDINSDEFVKYKKEIIYLIN
ncbi:ABC transporter ATP-binding protein [Paraclostridium sp. MRS3W1]|uniref:ABC transporter ATP-binding protein n=1 Tax=Paraclostridium sp. MRS3W1 TaxID=2800798 RepID=UPI0028FD01CE|nr:ABC transporter ATP-binding protein [Paraclostridium sp. MRS3W1]MDU0297003.1 ABC transporter ATP-binding protein [Paraclostridium sp. MRS3W1]